MSLWWATNRRDWLPAGHCRDQGTKELSMATACAHPWEVNDAMRGRAFTLMDEDDQ
jgi:hypothetical protein